MAPCSIPNVLLTQLAQNGEDLQATVGEQAPIQSRRFRWVRRDSYYLSRCYNEIDTHIMLFEELFRERVKNLNNQERKT